MNHQKAGAGWYQAPMSASGSGSGVSVGADRVGVADAATSTACDGAGVAAFEGACPVDAGIPPGAEHAPESSAARSIAIWDLRMSGTSE
jgi:hypothetical protein